MEFIKNPNDMTVLFDQDSPIYESCVNVMCQNLEEIITHITEFMVKRLNQNNLDLFDLNRLYFFVFYLAKRRDCWDNNKISFIVADKRGQ